jgi:general secretion pathway protein K
MKATRDRGFVLVATLWLLAALATLVSIWAVYMRDAAVIGSLREDELKIEAAERSAVALTALRIAGFAPGEAPPVGAFRFALRDARIDVAFVTESARVDLNGAPQAMLTKLFAALGANADEAAAIAGNVVAWRKGTSGGADADAYRAAGRSYAPRHAPFQDVLELSLVLGVTPGLMRRALPYLTVNNPSGQVDVRAADPLVLAALPNLDPERASSLLAARGGADFDVAAALGALGSARAYATASASGAVRVFVSVVLGDRRRAGAQIVILATPREAQPYRIAAWSDE